MNSDSDIIKSLFISKVLADRNCEFYHLVNILTIPIFRTSVLDATLLMLLFCALS